MFSVIDLKAAYHHIKMDTDSRHYAAFVYNTKKYQWKRMPFELNGTAFSVTAAMAVIVKDLKMFVGVYYEDIIIFFPR